MRVAPGPAAQEASSSVGAAVATAVAPRLALRLAPADRRGGFLRRGARGLPSKVQIQLVWLCISPRSHVFSLGSVF